jgi:hypothetical protein
MGKNYLPDYANAAEGSLQSFITFWKKNNPNDGLNESKIEEQYKLFKASGSSSTTSSGFKSFFDSQPDGGDLNKTNIGSKIASKILNFVDGTVKWTAERGNELLDTQIGKGNSRDATSKKILDVFAEGGINPLKLLEELGYKIKEKSGKADYILIR